MPSINEHYVAVAASAVYLYRVNQYEKIEGAILFNYDNSSINLYSRANKNDCNYLQNFNPHLTPEILLKEIYVDIEKFFFEKYQGKEKFPLKLDKIRVKLLPNLDEYQDIKEDLRYLMVIDNDTIFIFIKKIGVFFHLNEKLINKHIIRIYKNYERYLYFALKDIPLTTNFERRKILNFWNNTEKKFSFHPSIYSLFQLSVIKSPDSIAITHRARNISYKKLNNLVNELALLLLENGIAETDFVAIYLERSIEFFVAIFAILKLGATYIPLDLKYPFARINYIIEDSQPSLIITRKELHEQIASSIKTKGKEFIFIDLKELQKRDSKNASVDNRDLTRNTAYLMYTSGSTGNPKGVLITQQNIINYALWFNKKFKFKNNSIIDFSSSPGFDLSVACTLVPLMLGGAVAICDEFGKLDPILYLQHLQKHKVTHIELTPDYFSHLLSYNKEVRNLTSLKWIMLGGDALIKKDVEKWLDLRKNDKVVNEYGPTECTVAMTSNIINRKVLGEEENIPLGKPMFNAKVYVLDKFFNLLPPGIPGELYIAGACVAKGYLSHEQTAQRFLPNPFSQKKSDKMYKTGDLTYWLPNGNLGFIGRLDDQVKIRGFRVELYEIEEQISRHPLIKKCKVLIHTINTYPFLHAFIETVGKKIHVEELREYLKENLPDYMIPSKFILLESFPVNCSGKVDTNQLHYLIEENTKKIKRKTCREDQVTSLLIDIWHDLLGEVDIKEDSDFFNLGGNSLLLLQMLNKVNKIFSITIHAHNVFNAPTIAKMVEIINQFRKLQDINISLPLVRKNPQKICLSSPHNFHILFLLPSLGRTAYMYKDLAKYLRTKYSLYVLQDPGIEETSIKFASLEEMASYYVYEIKHLQSQGPYLIAGASFGATLAIEISHQLTKLNDTVAFLGLFDGWANYSKKLQNRDIFYEIMSPKLKGLPSNEALKLLNMEYEREQLLFSYKIPNISVPTALFKANELLPLFAEYPSDTNGFGEYCLYPMTIYNVSGNHENMVEEPYAKDLSAKLQDSLVYFLEEVV